MKKLKKFNDFESLNPIDQLIAAGNHIVLTKIFLFLDGKSLKNSRLVSRSWNSYILNDIWGHPYCKDVLIRRLNNRWADWIPSERKFQASGCVFDLEVDDSEIVLSLESGTIEVSRFK